MTGLRRFTGGGQAEGGRDAGVASPDAEPTAGRGAATPAEATRPEPLRRFLAPRRQPRPGEVCELCSQPVAAEHQHLVDTGTQGLLCACRACYLLFERPHAGGGTYRAVGDRMLRLDPFTLTPWQWSALDIPVGMAFLLRSSGLGRTVAFYPSPGGATESELSLDAWEDVVAANPALDDLRPDVEAALVRRVGDETECYVVPIDRCYELVGALRLHWRGFDGGQEVRERIAAFFDELRARSATVRGDHARAGAAQGTGGHR